MKRQFVCCAALVISAAMSFGGDLPPFELAGYKLGAYAGEYDAEGAPGKRKLEKPFLGFDEVEFKTDKDRLVWICLYAHHRISKPEDQQTSCENFQKSVRSRLRNCSWKAGSFSCYEDQVKGSLSSFGRFPDVYHTLTVAFSSFWSQRIDMEPYLKMVRTFPEPKTTAITNIFGVTLGTKIEDVSLPVKKLKKKNGDSWQYSFLPNKRFRSYNTYTLRVENGIVTGIRASYMTTDARGIKDLVDVVDVLRKRFQASFSWPRILPDGKVPQGLARHVGYGDDYTVLEAELKSIQPKSRLTRPR